MFEQVALLPLVASDVVVAIFALAKLVVVVVLICVASVECVGALCESIKVIVVLLFL
ncbi:hypothetical protein [Bathymodiolus japonicus methanotrophic gill symbiont]|uniref:hypothetical protein n=1 Tax=Bathymodiolus japonicus methanotrophic gill symbiont TaxID=113269 RepID=UPI001C8E92D7|nr:hypothetical protein [Bathymodiolus japonicus methanotrophic gill symbiont]